MCDRLKRTFEFAADQLNKNCVVEAAAVLFPFEISDQVVVGKADAVVVTVAVEDLFETFRGGERVQRLVAGRHHHHLGRRRRPREEANKRALGGHHKQAW